MVITHGNGPQVGNLLIQNEIRSGSFVPNAPSTIRVTWGLTPAEREFLTRLIAGGLGEYAYRNDLVEALTPTIEADTVTLAPGPGLVDPDSPPLVAVGGGKDSVVSIEACKQAGLEPILFSVNRYAAIDRCVTVAERPYVTASRRIDPTLFDLNRRGAHNGHVPVTAVNSLIGVLTSQAIGAGPLVMSNEASANEGNLHWQGHDINHQWSKSLAFEDLLRAALAAATAGEPPYFSLLRPFDELQIAERFARYDQYFPAFTSCNANFKLDPATRRTHWCCQCPKCLFVFLMLAPFLSPETLVGVFGQNLLDDPRHRAGYAEILGVSGHKPFECVGETSEARQALALAGAQASWRQSALVAEFLPQIGPDRFPGAPPAPPVTRNLPAAYLAAIGLA